MTDFENFLDLENYSTVVLTDEYGKEYTIVADIDPYNYN